MVDRQHIERVLRLNGIQTNASKEEIYTMLKKAGFTNEDVTLFCEAVISETKSNDKKTTEEKKRSTETLLKTDTALKPEYVRELLGIDMHVSNLYTQNVSIYRRQGTTILQTMFLFLLSFIFAGLGIVGYMWFFDVGLFHIVTIR